MEVEKSTLDAMLNDVPTNKRDAFLTDFKNRGYTIKGAAPAVNRMDDSKPGYSGPPNEPGLQDQGPLGAFTFTGAANEALRNAGQNMEDVKGPASLAAYPAGILTKMAGNIAPENWGQSALMMAMGGPIGRDVMAVAETVGRPVYNAVRPVIAGSAKAMGNALADLIGEMAGKDTESVKVLFNNPKAMWNKATEIFGRQDQKRTLDAIEKDFSERKEHFGAIEDSLSGNFGTPSYGKSSEVITRPAFDSVRMQMARDGFDIPKGMIEGYPQVEVGNIPSDKPEYKFLLDQVRKLRDKPRLSFGDAVRMKRNIDRVIDYGIEGSNGPLPVSEDANRLLLKIRNPLNAEIRTSLSPENRTIWDKVNSEYGIARQSRAELTKQVMGQNARLTEKKLHTLLREGRYEDEVLNRAADLGANAKARLEDVRDHIAARQFKQSVTRPSAANFLPSSPKTLGYAASGAGAASQASKSAMESLARAIHNYPLITQGLAAHLLNGDKSP